MQDSLLLAMEGAQLRKQRDMWKQNRKARFIGMCVREWGGPGMGVVVSFSYPNHEDDD